MFQGGGNDDLLPMIMMNGDQLFNNKADVPETQHELALCSDPDGYNKDDSIPPVNEDDGGVFHYEQDHESLEDEVFELHTANKNDADNEDVLRELLNEFQQTIHDIENENVKDSIVVGRVGDMNGDGVSDVDDDGDGLPNIVDEGLDALRELLDEFSMEDVVREVGEDTNTVMMSNEEQAEAELEALYEALNDDDVLEGFRVSEDEETIKARNAERATGRGGGGSSRSEL